MTLLVLVLVLVCTVQPSGIDSFVRVIGVSNQYDKSGAVFPTSDYGFVTGGSSNYDSNEWSFVVSKFNRLGVVEWSKSLSGGDSDYGNSIVEAEDGGFFGVGSTNSYGLGDYDILVSKFNSSGDVKWVRTIGSPDGGIDEGYFGMETDDGGYIVCGKTNGWSVSNVAGVVLKLNSTGGVEWGRIIRFGVDWTVLYGGYLASDGGFIGVGGTSNSSHIPLNNTSPEDGFFVHLDSNGDLNWARRFGGPYVETFYDVVETSDGGFVAVGKSDDYGLVAKISSSGDTEWITKMGNATKLFTVRETSLGELILGGTQWKDGAAYLLDSDGEVIWARTLESSHESTIFYAASELSDGGFILTGEGLYNLETTSDMVTSKINSNGTGCIWVEYEVFYPISLNVSSDDGDFAASEVISAYSQEPPNDTFTTTLFPSDVDDYECAWCDVGHTNPPDCDDYGCYGIPSDDDASCGVHGTCLYDDTCVCDDLYFFDDDTSSCNVTTCNGVYSNDSDVCSGNGYCDVFNTCQCDEDWYGEETCDVPTCYGRLANETDFSECGHGTCVDLNVCTCDENWYGEANSPCNITTCNGVFGNETEVVCSGQGTCVDFETCDCESNSGYVGSDCDEYISGYPFRSYVFVGRRLLLISYFMRSTEDVYNGANCSISERIENMEDLFGGSNESNTWGDIGCVWRRDETVDFSEYTSRKRRAAVDDLNVTHFEITLDESFPILSVDESHLVQLFSPTTGSDVSIEIYVYGKGPLDTDEDDEGDDEDDDGPIDPVPSSVWGGAVVAMSLFVLFVMFECCCLVCLGVSVVGLLVLVVVVFAWLYDLYGYNYDEMISAAGMQPDDGLTKLQSFLKNVPDDTLDSDNEEEEIDDDGEEEEEEEVEKFDDDEEGSSDDDDDDDDESSD